MSASSSHDGIRLYRHRLSGHSHRAELLLSLLGLPHELVDVDLKGQEQKTEAFLRLNPFGQAPVLDDRGTVIPDSNAILFYLALRHGGGSASCLSARWRPPRRSGGCRSRPAR